MDHLSESFKSFSIQTYAKFCSTLSISCWDSKVYEVDTMVHRTCVINLLLFKPPFHCIFHFWVFAIRMRSLPTDNLEEMILSVSTIVLYTTTIWISEIISDLCESICSQLSSFLDSYCVQINTIAWVLLFNSSFKYLLLHVEKVFL